MEQTASKVKGRIRALSRDEATPELRKYYDKNVETYGRVLSATGVYAYCPPIGAAYQNMNAAFARSGRLPEELRRLVCLRVAQLVGCPA